MTRKINRVGEIGYNNFGSKMIIINDRGYDDIDIYFEEYGYLVTNRSYSDFKKGKIKCPYERSICGYGYLGGKSNKDNPKMYKYWENMIRRCYHEESLKRHETYEKCYVCEELLCFEIFLEWAMENYYEVPNETMCLDKDILFKGNKIYSPETCIFVPQRINTLFVKKDKNRGDLPIGVFFDEARQKYIATWREADSRSKSKRFINMIDAFNCYKLNKERVIKEVADEYKDYIPTELYKAMYRYEVEIDD